MSGTLGRDSTLIRALRPTYEWMLNVTTGGRGVLQTLNGRERFRVDPRQRQHFPETYDPCVCDHLRKRVKPGSVCLDIGAHVGIYALCLAEWAGPSGHVFAFEPNPRTRDVLRKHVALNRFSTRITVLSEAVSDAPGHATLIAAGREGFSRLGKPNPAYPEGTPVVVPVTTVDAFCRHAEIAPDWIVMDVEGYEVAALAGARDTILAQHGAVGLVVELHPNVWEASGTSRARLESLLTELSLRPVPLTGQKDPLGEYGIVALEPAMGI